MTPATLVEPAAELRGAFLAMCNELVDASEAADQHRLALRDFDGYLERMRRSKEARDLPPGIVNQTTFWLVDSGRVVGECRLRHGLTPALRIEGGHIGYMIRPSARRRGYGTRILALALEEARDLDLGKVLLTCDTDNVGSARIIVKNGGTFAGEALSPESGKPVSRYWIDLDTSAANP